MKKLILLLLSLIALLSCNDSSDEIPQKEVETVSVRFDLFCDSCSVVDGDFIPNAQRSVIESLSVASEVRKYERVVVSVSSEDPDSYYEVYFNDELYRTQTASLNNQTGFYELYFLSYVGARE